MNEVVQRVEQGKERESLLSRFKKPSKQAFWAWVAYQTIKGTVTTFLFWVPLYLAYFH